MAHQVNGVVATAKGAPVELVPILVPDPGPGEALVRVKACGVCSVAGRGQRRAQVPLGLPLLARGRRPLLVLRLPLLSGPQSGDGRSRAGGVMAERRATEGRGSAVERASLRQRGEAVNLLNGLPEVVSGFGASHRLFE